MMVENWGRDLQKGDPWTLAAVQLLVAQFSISLVGGSFYWFGGWEFLDGHGCFANWDKTQEHG
jgi:hypothetical protein